MNKLERVRLYILFGLIISAAGFYFKNDMLIIFGAGVTGWCLGMWTNKKINKDKHNDK